MYYVLSDSQWISVDSVKFQDGFRRRARNFGCRIFVNHPGYPLVVQPLDRPCHEIAKVRVLSRGVIGVFAAFMKATQFISVRR